VRSHWRDVQDACCGVWRVRCSCEVISVCLSFGGESLLGISGRGRDGGDEENRVAFSMVDWRETNGLEESPSRETVSSRESAMDS
jgi:hypothetical protein